MNREQIAAAAEKGFRAAAKKQGPKMMDDDATLNDITTAVYEALLADQAAMCAALGVDDLDRLRQWFNALQDVSPKYLEPADHALAERLRAALQTQKAPQQPAFASAGAR